jgi:kinesin family protein 2/24
MAKHGICLCGCSLWGRRSLPPLPLLLLLLLAQVIRATAMGKQHAPFRQSRLTQVLQECFVGKACQTTVVGCVSPAEADLQETVNTLR